MYGRGAPLRSLLLLSGRALQEEILDRNARPVQLPDGRSCIFMHRTSDVPLFELQLAEPALKHLVRKRHRKKTCATYRRARCQRLDAGRAGSHI
jgi:hypothetical protein